MKKLALFTSSEYFKQILQRDLPRLGIECFFLEKNQNFPENPHFDGIILLLSAGKKARGNEFSGRPLIRLQLGEVLEAGKTKKNRLRKGICSWIHPGEIAFIIAHLLDCPEPEGEIIASSPHPVPVKEFHGAIKAVLGKRFLLSFPLFSSPKLLPEKLEKSGYSFRYPDIKSALSSLVTS